MDYSIILLFNIMIKTDSDFVNFSTNHKYIYFSLVVFLFFSLTSIVYILIFKILKLNRTVISFICFNLFVLILFLYLRSLYFLFMYHNEMTPLYINNLSLFAQYRYLFYSLIVILLGILWVLSFYIENFKNFLTIIKYPYIKEEIRLILYSWNNTIMGPLCSYFYKGIFHSTKFSKTFFAVHFILFYLLRFISACFFVNFSFFNGDLRLLLYILPFSFIIWILNFFDFYFKYFREGTTTFILELLKVEYLGTIHKEDASRDFITASIDNFKFKLSEEAKNQGFTLHDLEYLKGIWYQSNTIDLKFDHYYSYVKFFSIVSSLLLFFCWFKISYYFLFVEKHNNIVYMLPLGPVFRRSSMFFNNLSFTRSPREMYFVYEGKSMNHVKIVTKGAVSPGHPVSGDTCPNNPLEIKIEAGLTHNPNLPKNLGFKTVLLSDTGIPSDPKPIHAIEIPGGPVNVKKSHLIPPKTKESENFFKDATVKKKMDDLYKNDKNDNHDT